MSFARTLLTSLETSSASERVRDAILDRVLAELTGIVRVLDVRREMDRSLSSDRLTVSDATRDTALDTSSERDLVDIISLDKVRETVLVSERVRDAVREADRVSSSSSVRWDACRREMALVNVSAKDRAWLATDETERVTSSDRERVLDGCLEMVLAAVSDICLANDASREAERVSSSSSVRVCDVVRAASLTTDEIMDRAADFDPSRISRDTSSFIERTCSVRREIDRSNEASANDRVNVSSLAMERTGASSVSERDKDLVNGMMVRRPSSTSDRDRSSNLEMDRDAPAVIARVSDLPVDIDLDSMVDARTRASERTPAEMDLNTLSENVLVCDAKRDALRASSSDSNRVDTGFLLIDRDVDVNDTSLVSLKRRMEMVLVNDGLRIRV